MKRWAVFNDVDYYPSGGMNDFIGAFETKEDAEEFLKASDRYLCIEDMLEFLTRQSPPISKEKK